MSIIGEIIKIIGLIIYSIGGSRIGFYLESEFFWGWG